MNFIIVKIFKTLWEKKHKEKNEIENRVVYLGPSRFRFSMAVCGRSNLVEEGRLHECLSQCVHLETKNIVL